MTKTRSTKRALLMSGLALLMCVSMLIGSTFAWFTDSVTSSGNKIQSGTLKLDLELLDKETGWASIKESNAPIFDYDLWEPGYTDVKILKVENEGNLALKWMAKFVCMEELTDLAKVIDVYVRPYGVVGASAVTFPADRSLDGYERVGTVAEFVNTIESTTYGNLEAGESAYLGIALKMQESAGNEYQGMDLGGAFDIQILATQYTSESDSFNNQYDANAKFDGEPTEVSSAEEMTEALSNGEPVKLTTDLVVEELAVSAGTKAVIDLGGNALTVTNADTTAAFLNVEGDLTITGEGNVDVSQINTSAGSTLTLGEGVNVSTQNAFAINNKGTTVIDGATINHTGTNHAIQNEGTLIIDDATVTSTGSNISTISSTGGTVVINGGTFVHDGSMGSVICDTYGDAEIVINGGTFIQKDGDPLVNMGMFGKLTINGGIFDAESMFSNMEMNITINAGVFKNNATVTDYGFGSISTMVPATSTATTNADGSISVTVNN